MAKAEALSQLKAVGDNLERLSRAARDRYIAEQKAQADMAVEQAKGICARNGVSFAGFVAVAGGSYDARVAANVYSEFAKVR